MLYRPYGKTNDQVSALGMGGMRFEKPADIDNMAQVVTRAFQSGITYFDTAPGYCDDKSEIICGTAFKEMKKEGKRFYVATKTFAAEEDKIRAQLETSLTRLNVDAIDYYHIWCLLTPEDLPGRMKKGVLAAFRKFKEEGLIRHICVSTHLDHGQVATMLDEGEGDFEGMLIGLNATNFHLREEGIRAAAQRGMGVVTMNTLGGGLLTDHADHYSFLMRDGDKSVLDAALRFNLSLPEVTVALVGFRNVADVDSAVEAMNRFSPLASAEIEAYKQLILKSSANFCTQCNYCHDCPAGIPVVRVMEAYNRRILTGDPQNSLDQLKWHWGTPDITALLEKCTACRRCEEACTQHLPILERFDQLREDHKKSKQKSN